MMVGNNLKDTQLQQVLSNWLLILLSMWNLLQIVDKTILFHDKDNNGKINFEEFCEVWIYSIDVGIALHLTGLQVVGNTDIHTKMVVEVWVLELIQKYRNCRKHCDSCK